MGPYMTVVVILHFLWTKETMPAKADAGVQHSAVCIVSACSWLRPHLCSFTCMKQFVNSSRERSLRSFPR